MHSVLRAQLQQMKQADLAGDVPSVSETVGRFLHEKVLEQTAQRVLEIGCAHAYSTLWLASSLEQTGGELVTIDHSEPSFKIAQKNVQDSGLTNIEMCLGRAQSVIPNLVGEFDLVFIDGIKASTLEFFDLVVPKLAPGGVIIVDDVLKFRYKMEDFWQFMDNQNDWRFEVHKLDTDDGVMVIEKG